MTVLKQEIPSPFGNDQIKKIAKTSPLNKEQVDEISQIEQATNSNAIKNANNTNGNGNNVINVTGAANPNSITCHLNGNSNSSASNDLVNCLDNVPQTQSNQNDHNDERNDSNILSKCKLGFKLKEEQEKEKEKPLVNASANIFIYRCRNMQRPDEGGKIR